MWCWRRLLRIPWTTRRSNQSVLKEINPEYSLEGLMLKLKLQYFGHLMQSVDSLEKKKISDAGKDQGRGWQRMRWLDSNTNSVNMNLSKSRRQRRTEEPGTLPSGGHRGEHDLGTKQQQSAMLWTGPFHRWGDKGEENRRAVRLQRHVGCCPSLSSDRTAAAEKVDEHGWSLAPTNSSGAKHFHAGLPCLFFFLH